MVNIDKSLRKLARSSYWQNLYRASQKCSNISLFSNFSDYSGIQVKFLYWLQTYQMLYDELSTFEDERLTENVIENDFRADAYLIHRNKKHEFLWKKYREDESNSRRKANHKKKFKHPGKESIIKVDLRREK